MVFLKFLIRDPLLISDGKVVIISRGSEITLLNNDNKEIHRYKLPYGAVISYKDGDKIKKGDNLAEWDPYNIPIIAEESGIIKYYDLSEGVSLRERIDEATGVFYKKCY